MSVDAVGCDRGGNASHLVRPGEIVRGVVSSMDVVLLKDSCLIIR